ncbi:thioesterase superfamily protein [Klebsiella aerogenes]|nr:thioesterase superfamily protein [Klebsiella aerogenes]
MVLRTLAMPADTNANGDIFGGWLMSQMDIGGAIMAKEIAQGRVVTVRVDGMTFFTPGRRWRRGVLLRPLREARQHLGDN